MTTEEINGVKRSFLLGTKTFVYIHELTGVSKIDEVFERLVNKRKKKNLTIENFDPSNVFEDEPIECEIKHLDFVSKVFFCLAKTGAEVSGSPVDFTEAITSYWIDVIGYKKATDIVNNCIESFNGVNEKNALAPRISGLKKTG